MKCPKCAYVGFEPAPRCRHCGYEFSLLTDEPALTMLADPVLKERAAPPATSADPVDDLPLALDPPPADDPRLDSRAARMPSLFAEPPPPARAPLAVRKTTAERPRSRPAAVARPRPMLVERPLADATDGAAAAAEDAGAPPAPAIARTLAAVIDLAVLTGVDATIVYLTLQLSRLSLDDLQMLPLLPMATFIGGLNLTYFVVFTAQGGQTLGKMAAGLRVEPTAGALTTGTAVLRVLGALAGVLLAGAGWWIALVRADRRAAHDHLARTRVVKVAA